MLLRRFNRPAILLAFKVIPWLWNSKSLPGVVKWTKFQEHEHRDKYRTAKWNTSASSLAMLTMIAGRIPAPSLNWRALDAKRGNLSKLPPKWDCLQLQYSNTNNFLFTSTLKDACGYRILVESIINHNLVDQCGKILSSKQYSIDLLIKYMSSCTFYEQYFRILCVLFHI